MIDNLLGYFEEHQSYVKTTWLLLWQFFLQHLVTLLPIMQSLTD